MTTQPERRLSKRKAPEQLTYVELPSGNGGLVLNVSDGGFAFQAVAPLKSCGPVLFWFSALFLSANSGRIEGTGELAWTDEEKKTGGLRFTQLSAGASGQIPTWPNETDRRLDGGEDSPVRPQRVEELPEIPARDELLPSITSETSRDSAVSGPSPHPQVFRLEMDPQVLRWPRNSYFWEHNRSRFKAISVSVLVIMIAVLSYVYREAGKTRHTNQIPSPASNLSSEAAPVGAVLGGKSNLEDAPKQAAPQSSRTSARETAKLDAAGPRALEASAADSLEGKPPLRRGAFMVQVGAFAHEDNARKVADSLRQKNFPALVSVTSTESALYRVQVGPYADEESARLAQSELERAGFKPWLLH